MLLLHIKLGPMKQFVKKLDLVFSTYKNSSFSQSEAVGPSIQKLTRINDHERLIT